MTSLQFIFEERSRIQMLEKENRSRTVFLPMCYYYFLFICVHAQSSYPCVTTTSYSYVFVHSLPTHVLLLLPIHMCSRTVFLPMCYYYFLFICVRAQSSYPCVTTASYSYVFAHSLPTHVLLLLPIHMCSRTVFLPMCYYYFLFICVRAQSSYPCVTTTSYSYVFAHSLPTHVLLLLPIHMCSRTVFLPMCYYYFLFICVRAQSSYPCVTTTSYSYVFAHSLPTHVLLLLPIHMCSRTVFLLMCYYYFLFMCVRAQSSYPCVTTTSYSYVFAHSPLTHIFLLAYVT